MIDILKPSMWRRLIHEQSGIVAQPEPFARRSPVFIHDAITPCLGETLLLKLLREQAKADGTQS
jgi:hypothetical protein